MTTRGEVIFAAVNIAMAHCFFLLQTRSDSLVIDELHLALQESKICMHISAFFKYSYLAVMHCNWNFNDFATDLKFQGYKSAV